MTATSLIPILVVLSALAGAPSGAQEAGGDDPAPPAVAPSALDARVRAVLDDWDRARAAWVAAGRPEPHPAQAFFPRFEELAARGWGAARVWSLEHLEQAGLAPSRRRERRAALVDRLLASADSAPVGSVERVLLELEAHAPELVDDARLARVEALLELRAEPAVRAAAHAALARLRFVRLAAGADPAAVEQQLHLARAAAPRSPGARRATTFLFELRERAYRTEVERWAAAWSDGDAGTEPGLHPVELYWPSMQHLADGGAGRALWWMAREARLLEREDQELAALRSRLLERLVEEHSDEPWLREELQFNGALVEDLGREELERLGRRLLEAADDPELRAWVLHGLASLAASDESDDARVRQAIELIERLMAEHPGHPLALSAEDRLFALRHLRVGQIPPERRAQDGRGRELTLGQYRGRLTLLVFWGFWSPQAERDLARLRALDARYAPEPFAIVGVNTDDDPTAARRRFLAGGNGWRNVYEGRRSGPWTQSWSVRDFPTYFLFAPDGRVLAKGVDLSAIEARLAAEVEALRAARRRPGRAAAAAAGDDRGAPDGEAPPAPVEAPVEGAGDPAGGNGPADGSEPVGGDEPAGGDEPVGGAGDGRPNPTPRPNPAPDPDAPTETGKPADPAATGG